MNCFVEDSVAWWMPFAGGNEARKQDPIEV